MYFWRIEKLKAEMVARPLSEREALSYLIVSTALTAVTAFIPATMNNIWDVLGAAWGVLLGVMGTLYIYRRNGGAAGQHFLQRYFAVGWVVSLRWLVVIVLVAVGFFATLAALEIEAETTTWYVFLFVAVAEVVVYWRIGHHVGDLASRTKAV